MDYEITKIGHRLTIKVIDIGLAGRETLHGIVLNPTERGVDRSVVEKYLQSLINHITYVREAGLQIGVNPQQLAEHDASKFSLQEFPQYARQYAGDSGDPDGWANAWLHHIHHNPHHWQYYIFPDGYSPKGSKVENGAVPMPPHFALEMVADWMGASMAYTGSFDMTDWLVKNMSRIRLHSETADFVNNTLDMLGYADVVWMQRWAGA
jgi:hypothetical protein